MVYVVWAFEVKSLWWNEWKAANSELKRDGMCVRERERDVSDKAHK